MGIRFTSRIKQWTSATESKLDNAVADVSALIHREAIMLAPKASRILVDSGIIKRIGVAHYQIQFGGGSVRYARRRHYENNKNPQTLRYLERAGDNNARNIKQRIKGI